MLVVVIMMVCCKKWHMHTEVLITMEWFRHATETFIDVHVEVHVEVPAFDTASHKHEAR